MYAIRSHLSPNLEHCYSRIAQSFLNSYIKLQAKNRTIGFLPFWRSIELYLYLVCLFIYLYFVKLFIEYQVLFAVCLETWQVTILKSIPALRNSSLWELVFTKIPTYHVGIYRQVKIGKPYFRRGENMKEESQESIWCSIARKLSPKTHSMFLQAVVPLYGKSPQFPTLPWWHTQLCQHLKEVWKHSFATDVSKYISYLEVPTQFVKMPTLL